MALVSTGQISGFFDSTMVVETVEGFPKGDKAVDAGFVADFVSTFFSDGVARDYGDAFRVTADGASGGVVSVGSGRCLIRGRFAYDGSPETLDIGFSESDRTVIIAQRLDVTTAVNAAITKTVITAVTDVPVNTNTVQDIWLARVVIPGGTVNITQAMITDLRGTEFCPWVIAPMASADWEALPSTVQGGFTRIATANGGTGDAFTATVPNFDEISDANGKIAIRIIPVVNSNANATLAVNGGAAYPLYKSDGDPCALYSLRAGIPVDVVFYQGKYFFKSGGSGAEFTKYATGAATVVRKDTETGVHADRTYIKLLTHDLTFKPRLLYVTAADKNSEIYSPHGYVANFNADGSISKIIDVNKGSNSYASANEWFDTSNITVYEDGFETEYFKFGYSSSYPTPITVYYAYA